MNNESSFETIGDADLDNVSGGRHHYRVARGVVGYGYPTVPAIAPAYAYAPAAYPAYGYGYPGYGMRLGTAI